MAKINPKASILIDEYIESLPSFSKEICKIIRSAIHKSQQNITEDWKWKIPVFHTTKMVCGFAAFKNHVSLTFFDGAIMRDQHQLFSGDCSAQKTRTIKFKTNSEIYINHLIDYFKEAFLLSEVAHKRPKKKEIVIPKLFQDALNKNKIAKQNFEKMAYTYRKEYASHISGAKRETTKINRLEKVILNLEKNIKMHEQYKC